MEIEIRDIEKNEYEKTFNFVKRIFMKYEAPDYSEEGVNSFIQSVMYNREYQDSLKVYGAFCEDKLVGVIATRNSGNHIALFFVEGTYHRQGIGKKLFRHVLRNNTIGRITVNSSPYAVEVYHHLGFIDTDKEQITDGVRYTPMVYECPCKHNKCENHNNCILCREKHSSKKRKPAGEREKRRGGIWRRK